MTLCNLKLILITLIIIYFIKILYSKENFSNELGISDFKSYNNSIYPLTDKITCDEKIFIEKWIKRLNDRDIKMNKNIIPYKIGFTIDKKNYVNRSRFTIGTLTYYREFKRDCLNILKKYQINLIEPKNYLWHAMAWDINDSLLKVYLINSQISKIICYVYKVKRNKKTIIDIDLSDTKYYSIGKNKTILYKKNKKVVQVKNDTLPYIYNKRYPNSLVILRNMNNEGWDLNSYSEYDNKLNLYFY